MRGFRRGHPQPATASEAKVATEWQHRSVPRDRDTPLRRVWSFLGTISLIHWLVVAGSATVSIVAAGIAELPTPVRILLALSVFAFVLLALLVALQHMPALAHADTARAEQADPSGSVALTSSASRTTRSGPSCGASS
jgi:hypothetical protein